MIDENCYYGSLPNPGGLGFTPGDLGFAPNLPLVDVDLHLDLPLSGFSFSFSCFSFSFSPVPTGVCLTPRGCECGSLD